MGSLQHFTTTHPVFYAEFMKLSAGLAVASHAEAGERHGVPLAQGSELVGFHSQHV